MQLLFESASEDEFFSHIVTYLVDKMSRLTSVWRRLSLKSKLRRALSP